MDVNEWINNECAESMLSHLNIPNWFTHSHPSKAENHPRNRSEIARVNGPLERPLHYFPVSHSLPCVCHGHKGKTQGLSTQEQYGKLQHG
jgi:hypothetical protein